MSQDNLNTPAGMTIETKEYRLAPMWRRIPLYIGLAGLCIPALVYIAGGHPVRLNEAGLACVALALALLIFIVQQNWLIRVDEQGIARHRFLLDWDLFAWEDFAAGRIRRGLYWEYIDRNKKIGRRMLDLSALHPADQKDIQKIITRFWTPPRVDLPERIKFRPKRGFRLTQWIMSDQGLTVCSPRQQWTYSWDDVASVTITRFMREHADFWEMNLTLPYRKLALSLSPGNSSENRSWSGAPGEQIAAMVLCYAPRESVHIFTYLGPPANIEDAHRRMEQLQRRFKDRTRLFWILGTVSGAFLTAGLIFGYFLHSFIGFVFPWAFLSVMCGFFAIGARPSHRAYLESAQEIDQWLAEQRAEASRNPCGAMPRNG